MQHRVQNDLETANFESSIRMVKTPEGYCYGIGTTVGNGVQGWAPGAIFIDTDAAQGSQVFVNTGSKTSATWTEIADAGVSGGFTMVDSAAIVLGTGSDISITWDGTKLTSGPAAGLWAGAPSELSPSPRSHFTFFDDFFEAPLDANLKWLEVDDGSTGTNAVSDIIGGVGTVVTAAANDDHHAISSRGESFKLSSTKELWFEARFRVVEAATNQSTWWFGLTSDLTTGGMQTAGSGPLGTYDGVLIYKIEGAMAIDAETSNASSQDIETGLATFVTNTWTRVGFHVSADATTAVVTPYFDVSDTAISQMTAGTPMNLTRSGLDEMHLVAGIKSGGSVEPLEIDYIKCVQIR